MSRRTILGWSLALFSALGVTLAAPTDAHARRRCNNGGYGYSTGWFGRNGRTYAYNTAPVATTSSCAGTAAPMNPDGSYAPQPAAPTPPAPPEDVPAPAPSSTTSQY